MLVLIGGGEFSFEETLDADREWLEKTPPGPVGFIPAASGSADYGSHFATYLLESFERPVEIIPVYRDRDARRGRNAQRIESAAAVYIGGGVADQLIEALAGSPALEALERRRAAGGVVVAIAAGADAAHFAEVKDHGHGVGSEVGAPSLDDHIPAVGIGLGLVHRSDMFAAIDNTVTLPGYTRADGALFLKVGSALSAQVNVENLLDETYYSTSHGNNNIMPGAPRTVRISLTTRR